jgi:dUTP pyrophosphatase
LELFKIKDKMQVKFKKLNKDAKIPQYMTKGAAGFDFSSIENVTLSTGDRIAVDTGLSCKIQDGFEMQIRPRSGMALKQGITVLNAPGTIDSDYTGPIKIILVNLGDSDVVIKAGDRIAQGVISPVEQAEFLEVDKLDETERGEGGFGSTGK